MNLLRRPPLALLLGAPWLLACVVALCWQAAAWMGQPARDALVRARAVADLADAYRLHVVSRGAIYTAQNMEAPQATRAVQTVSVLSPRVGSEAPQKLVAQDAFVALQDLASTVVSSGAVASLRAVSDNPFNPASGVTFDERNALAAMRDRGETESWSTVGGVLRYARALKADSSCMVCHGDATQAPEAIRASYAATPQATSGFGYQVGSVVGLTSVAVELGGLEALQRNQWPVQGAQALATVLVVTFGWGLTCSVVCPAVRRRVAYAQRLAAADPDGALPFAPQSADATAREFGQLDRALEVLHEGAFAAADLAAAQAKSRL